MSVRFCPDCGHPVTAGSAYCMECGRELDHATITETPPARETVPWRAFEGIGIFIASIIVLGIGAYLLTLITNQDDIVTVSAVLLQELALFSILIVWVRGIHHARAEQLWLRAPTAENIGLGVAIGFGGIILSIAVGAIIQALLNKFSTAPVKAPDQIILKGHPTTLVYVITGISVIVLAPIAEETFFRGFIYRGLRRWAKPWPAILMSAFVFGIVHIQGTIQSTVLVVPAVFSLGILLAWIAEKRQSLVPGMVAHGLFNVLGFIVQFVLRK